MRCARRRAPAPGTRRSDRPPRGRAGSAACGGRCRRGVSPSRPSGRAAPHEELERRRPVGDGEQLARAGDARFATSPSVTARCAQRRPQRARRGRRRAEQHILIEADQRALQHRRQRQVVLGQQQRTRPSATRSITASCSVRSIRSTPATGTLRSFSARTSACDERRAAAHQHHDVARRDRPPCATPAISRCIQHRLRCARRSAAPGGSAASSAPTRSIGGSQAAASPRRARRYRRPELDAAAIALARQRLMARSARGSSAIAARHLGG